MMIKREFIKNHLRTVPFDTMVLNLFGEIETEMCRCDSCKELVAKYDFYFHKQPDGSYTIRGVCAKCYNKNGARYKPRVEDNSIDLELFL